MINTQLILLRYWRKFYLREIYNFSRCIKYCMCRPLAHVQAFKDITKYMYLPHRCLTCPNVQYKLLWPSYFNTWFHLRMISKNRQHIWSWSTRKYFNGVTMWYFITTPALNIFWGFINWSDLQKIIKQCAFTTQN